MAAPGPAAHQALARWQRQAAISKLAAVAMTCYT
jgi:hypothetical protein